MVLMAQGPGRKGCELWGRCRSHTLEKVVLESWGSQHSSQLRRQSYSDPEIDTDGLWGSPDCCLLLATSPPLSYPCYLVPMPTSKWAPEAYLSTKPFVDLDQNVNEREEGSEEWEG